MSGTELHQLLHGYKKGHEQLASSITLSQKDAELVVRLSDLSGTLQSEAQFQPYLTIYPLPTGKYYAVAQTWLDSEAPRSGCVLTHTILIPIKMWQSSGVDPGLVLSLLRRPNRNSVKEYSRELWLPDDLGEEPGQSPPFSPLTNTFVAKYFGEGMRPIVWFDELEPEILLLCIIRSLWPALRSQFAACTFSLQPRTLPSAPFDVLFAPSSTYSRFTKIPRENFLESGKIPKQGTVSEPWCDEFAKSIFSSGNSPPIPNWFELASTFGPEPTAIRSLFLLNDLQKRATHSPSAALGAMDIVETISPQGTENSEFKSSLARTAIDAALTDTDAGEALEHLQLVCERLEHDAFRSVGQDLLREIADGVASKATKEIDRGLSSYESSLSRVGSDSSSLRAYRSGLVEALIQLSLEAPQNLLALRRHGLAASDIIRANPDVAAAYLRIESAHSSKSEGAQTAQDVLEWVRSSVGYTDWEKLAEVLLRSAKYVREDDLYEELFSHLSQDDVELLLQKLSDVHGIADSAVLGVIERRLAVSFPYSVQNWIFRNGEWGDGASRIAAATFQMTAAGINQVLADSRLDDRKRAAVLADLLMRILDTEFSGWLRDYVLETPAVLEELFRVGNENSNSVIRCLSRLMRQLHLLPMSVVTTGTAALQSFVGTSIYSELRNSVLRSAVVWSIREEGNCRALAPLMSSTEAREWFGGVDSSSLVGLITGEAGQGVQEWTNAWRWLQNAPREIDARGNVIQGIVAYLCRRPNSHWSAEVAEMWAAILSRSQQTSERRIHLKYCIQAIQFSFSHGRLPLSAIVIAGFPSVYAAVTEQWPSSGDVDVLLSFMDWDRAKALRGALVDAFMGSAWPAGDLAIVAAKTFGVRKLFKRVNRKWYGESYIRDMARDLSNRNDREAVEVRRELFEIMANPNFYEQWD